MPNMTDQARVAAIVNAILAGAASPAWPTGLRLRLMTAQGSNTTNGTEATAANCPGYTPGGVAITFGSNSAGTSTSTNTQTWTATAAWATIAAGEVWDIAATALRWLQGALSANISGVSTGDTIQFPPGAVTANAAAW